MTDTKPLTPTDAEIATLYAEQTGFALDDSPAALLDFARAVLAKFGTLPPVAGEPVAWLDPWSGAHVTTDPDAYGKHGIPLVRQQPAPSKTPASSADTQDMRYAHGWVTERCKEVKRAMDVVVELERRGMLEAQPVVREPLTEQQLVDIFRSIDSEDKGRWAVVVSFARAIERAHRITGGNA